MDKEKRIVKIKSEIKRLKALYYHPSNRRSNGKQTQQGMEKYYYPMTYLKLILCELEGHMNGYIDSKGERFCYCSPVSEETKKYYAKYYKVKI